MSNFGKTFERLLDVETTPIVPISGKTERNWFIKSIFDSSQFQSPYTYIVM